MMQSELAAAVDAFVPPMAPLMVLAFLGSACLVFGGTLAAVIALAAKRTRLAKILGGGALALSVAYGTALVGASLLSSPRTLKRGEKKYFCEIDCHLAYSLESAESPNDGNLAIVVRTWFDPSTIASFRGEGPLTPNPRVVWVVDGSGRRYAPKASASEPPGFAPLTRSLRPGESYRTRLVFETPPGARDLRLYVGDAPGLESAIVNHENSPWHAKVDFAVPPATGAGRAHS